MSVNLSKDELHQLAGQVIAAWGELYPDLERKRRGDPGARAALRRAASPEALLIEEAFYDLLARMRDGGCDFSGWPAKRYLRLALVLGALAERRADRADGPPLAEVLGGKAKPEDRLLKPLRFQSLIAALDREVDGEALIALRRTLKLAADKEKIDLYRLVRDLMNWGQRTRIDWTFAYFGQSDRPAPARKQATETEELAR